MALDGGAKFPNDRAGIVVNRGGGGASAFVCKLVGKLALGGTTIDRPLDGLAVRLCTALGVVPHGRAAHHEGLWVCLECSIDDQVAAVAKRARDVLSQMCAG